MDSKETVENIFKNNGIAWKVKEYNTYIDPKCKTAKSIYSKLTRLYNNSKNEKEYTVKSSGIKDLIRMTIITEYSEVIPIIQKLRQSFPDLSGYINYKESGYRGVHLNLKIDGLPCEIQLSPKIIVMGVEYLHTLHEKWRDFNSLRELEELTKRKQEILKDKNIQNKNKALKILSQKVLTLNNKIKEEAKDLELRNKTYNDIFNAASFPIYEKDIARTIYTLNRMKEDSSPLNNKILIDIFNKNLLSEGELDKNKVMKVSEELNKNLKLTQDKFVKLITNCLNL